MSIYEGDDGRYARAALSKPRRSVLFAAIVSVLILAVVTSIEHFPVAKALMRLPILSPTAFAATSASVASPFHYQFVIDEILHESGSMLESTSPYWWLNSGGMFILEGGRGKTIQRTLPENDPWRRTYATTNPVDTALGFQPQNILRLVTKSAWENFQQEVYVRITRHNLTESPQRNASNGVLLFNRYKDGKTLYYTGLRVDGKAIIKKKFAGYYTTLASVNILDGRPYDRTANPSLLPKDQWFGIKSIVKDLPDGSVRIELFTDTDGDGVWQKAASATDTGIGGVPIRGSGYAGIRTDFIDAEFDDYKIENL